MKNVIPMVNHEQQARTTFQGHVQSVAFHISLSRTMIDMLAAIRDYGFPHDVIHDGEYRNVGRRYSRNDNFIVAARGLINRGLVYHNGLVAPGITTIKDEKRAYLLSKSGEIMCDLLVEAGLLSPAVKQSRKSRKQ